MKLELMQQQGSTDTLFFDPIVTEDLTLEEGVLSYKGFTFRYPRTSLAPLVDGAGTPYLIFDEENHRIFFSFEPKFVVLGFDRKLLTHNSERTSFEYSSISDKVELFCEYQPTIPEPTQAEIDQREVDGILAELSYLDQRISRASEDFHAFWISQGNPEYLFETMLETIERKKELRLRMKALTGEA